MATADSIPDLSERIHIHRDAIRARLTESFAVEQARRRRAGQFFFDGYWLTEPQLARLKKVLNRRRFMALVDFHILLAVTGAVVWVVCKIFDVFFFP